MRGPTADPGPPQPPRVRPVVAATLAVGLAVGGLIVGYEPVGADPDLMYRPIKAELARAIHARTLPFWSDRLGLGVPLVAESHAAAFYPPNWALYGLLGVNVAYRLAMGLHFAAIVAATYAYGRAIGLTDWGAALAGLTFALCGFQAVHCGHEPFYHALPYLPLCLLAADRYAATGRPVWLALLALGWGAQLTLGHFQIQLWTGGLAVWTGLWRVVADRRPWRRGAGLVAAAVWGLMIATVQLVLTKELVDSVGFDRPFEALSNYAFPPEHWAQPAVPELFLALPGGPEDAYWGSLRTTGAEASFYVGTLPLILAAVGWVSGGRGLRPWRWVVVLSLVLATMPRWWPDGYWAVTLVPGFGWFRCPARYTVLASLGLALLAGRGLDRSIAARRFNLGLGLAIALGVASFAWCGYRLASRPEFLAALGPASVPWRLGAAVVVWALALAVVSAWRRGRVGGGSPLALAAVELAALFHAGPVAWGWSVPVPGPSPVFAYLAREPGVRLVGGRGENLPVRAGLTAAYPYLGITPPAPNYLLERSHMPERFGHEPTVRWFARFGLTHTIWPEEQDVPEGVTVLVADDPVLDRLLHDSTGRLARRKWKVVRHPGAAPPAHVARREAVHKDWSVLYTELSRAEADEVASFLPADQPPPPAGPWARSTRLVSWDGRSGVVEHDGACDLIVNRPAYPGWTATVDGRPTLPIASVDGGLQAIRIDGPGPRSRVVVRYQPTGFRRWAPVSLVAALAAVILGCADLIAGRLRSHRAAAP